MRRELTAARRHLTNLEDELRALPVDEYYAREHELFETIEKIELLEEAIING